MADDHRFAMARVHWPTGPVNACGTHANGLLVLGAAMGIKPHVEMLPAHTTTLCTNCENLIKQGKPLPDET